MWDIMVMSLTISALYGISPLLHKYVIDSYNINSYTMMLISSTVFFACSLICYVFYKDIVKNDVKTLKTHTHILILLLLSAFFSVFIANLLYFKVLHKANTKSYIVSSLIFTSPLFTLLLSYLLIKESIKLTAVLGVILVVSGIVVISYAWFF